MKREIVEYNPNLKERARELRNNATPMEKKLWKFLKGKQMEGFDFHRQKPINNFILDFYCNELRLAIEIDGSSHIGKEEADFERQKIIESFGISFLRFTNTDVSKNIEGVIEVIRNWIRTHPGFVTSGEEHTPTSLPQPPLSRGENTPTSLANSEKETIFNHQTLTNQKTQLKKTLPPPPPLERGPGGV